MSNGGVEPFPPRPSAMFGGSRHKNSTTGADPIHLTTSWPFQSSHTSFDVDDIRSASATARFSLALPMIALSHEGPPTRMALITAVIIPSGAIAMMKLSAQPMDWLMNCIVTRSPKSARSLRKGNNYNVRPRSRILYDCNTYGAKSENRLLEKSLPGSAARHPETKSMKFNHILLEIDIAAEKHARCFRRTECNCRMQED